MGCSKTVTESDLVGSYAAEYPFGTDRISLQANGEYVQEFTPSGTNTAAIAKGRWTYDQATHYLTFENRLVVYDDHWKLAADYSVPKKGLSVLPAKKFFRTTIGINPDLGWEYVKNEPKRTTTAP